MNHVYFILRNLLYVIIYREALGIEFYEDKLSLACFNMITNSKDFCPVDNKVKQEILLLCMEYNTNKLHAKILNER